MVDWREIYDECPKCGGMVVEEQEELKEDGHYTIYIHPGAKAIHPAFGVSMLVRTRACRVRRELTDDERERLLDRQSRRIPF